VDALRLSAPLPACGRRFVLARPILLLLMSFDGGRGVLPGGPRPDEVVGVMLGSGVRSSVVSVSDVLRCNPPDGGRIPLGGPPPSAVLVLNEERLGTLVNALGPCERPSAILPLIPCAALPFAGPPCASELPIATGRVVGVVGRELSGVETEVPFVLTLMLRSVVVAETFEGGRRVVVAPNAGELLIPIMLRVKRRLPAPARDPVARIGPPARTCSVGLPARCCCSCAARSRSRSRIGEGEGESSIMKTQL
jgi:hypothetical protein